MDATGTTVELATPPARLVSLIPTLTEMVYVLGEQDRLVGVTRFCDYPPAAQSKTIIGGLVDPNQEQVLALQPDLVLAMRLNPLAVITRLRESGLKVYAIDPTTLEEVLRDLLRLAEILGVPARGNTVVAGLLERVATVKKALMGVRQRPLVYYGTWEPPFYTAGPGAFVHDLIEAAGGRNLAADLTESRWPMLSVETIFQRNPEVILRSMAEMPHEAQRATHLAALRQTAGWRDLTAVREGRIVYLPENHLVRAGPRLVDGLEELARALHPECFPAPPELGATGTTGETSTTGKP